MFFDFPRFLILVLSFLGVYVASGSIWHNYNHQSLLSGLASLVFVPTPSLAVCYHAIRKYGELLQKEQYTLSEFNRLRRIVQIRLKRTYLYMFFSACIPVVLVSGRLLTPFPTILLGYFQLACILLAGNIILFSYFLFDLREIDQFASSLDERHRAAQERQRLLQIVKPSDD